MDLKINEDLCIGCGSCADIAPELIEMNDEQIASVTVSAVGDDLLDSANAAIEACPVDAVYNGSSEDSE